MKEEKENEKISINFISSNNADFYISLRGASGGESKDAGTDSYSDNNGQLKGYSIELVKRFASHEGMDIAFEVMDFADSIYDDRLGIITLKK